MNPFPRRVLPLAAALLLLPFAQLQAQTKEAAPMSSAPTQHATGTFEVKITPLTLEDKSAPGNAWAIRDCEDHPRRP